MITLHQYRPAFGLPNPSPFCMKVETYLRMARIEFRLDNDASPMRAPRKKLPFIDDDGRVIADSALIIEHLKATRGDPLDGHLTAGQRSLALAFRRLIEEHLYWCGIYSRFVEDAGWALIRPAFFGGLPPLVCSILPPIARRMMAREAWQQGVGRHGAEEVYAMGCEDLDALSEFLASKSYFLGEQPTSLDATAYAFLANYLWAPIEFPLKRHGLSLGNLDGYCKRMKARCFA